jgi:hypothetical protein
LELSEGPQEMVDHTHRPFSRWTGGLLVLAKGSALAPFIYSLF